MPRAETRLVRALGQQIEVLNKQVLDLTNLHSRARADLDWAIRQVKLLAQVEQEPDREGPEPGKPWADVWEAAGPQRPVATGYLGNIRLTGTREPVVVEHPAAPQPVPAGDFPCCTGFTVDDAGQLREGMHMVNLGRIATVSLGETFVRITDVSGRVHRFRRSDQVWIHR